MNKITCLVLAGFAAVLFPLSAAKAQRDAAERASWSETVRQGRVPANSTNPPPRDERGAAQEEPAAVGVEPYIARRIDIDRRSHR